LLRKKIPDFHIKPFQYFSNLVGKKLARNWQNEVDAVPDAELVKNKCVLKMKS
jgi:hypothetical protein